MLNRSNLLKLEVESPQKPCVYTKEKKVLLRFTGDIHLRYQLWKDQYYIIKFNKLI